MHFDPCLRFGIKLSKSTPEQQNSAPAQDTDLPLSEGFHWESVPDVFPTPHIPPPALNQPDTVSTTEEPPEPPRPAGAENHTGTARTEAAVFVKVEQVEEGNVEQNGNTRKRSHMVRIIKVHSVVFLLLCLIMSSLSFRVRRFLRRSLL